MCQHARRDVSCEREAASAAEMGFHRCFVRQCRGDPSLSHPWAAATSGIDCLGVTSGDASRSEAPSSSNGSYDGLHRPAFRHRAMALGGATHLSIRWLRRLVPGGHPSSGNRWRGHHSAPSLEQLDPVQAMGERSRWLRQGPGTMAEDWIRCSLRDQPAAGWPGLDFPCVCKPWPGTMRRTVVVKGIAGLGNRMQVLGLCCDLASRWKAVLCVDWTHNSWSESFENYFRLSCPSEKAFLRSEGGFGKVVPPRYSQCVTRDPLKSQQWLNGDFLTDLDQLPEGPWDTFVACGYLAQYSNRLFRILSLNQDFRQLVVARMNGLGLVPGVYDCWHVRHTDASGGCPKEILGAIVRYSRHRRTVVITDSSEVVELCRQLNITCPSIVPSLKAGGGIGIHHLHGGRLSQEGLSKQDVNQSVMTDMFIAGLARHFWGTCQHSSFSSFIYRGRLVSWFRCVVLGEKMNFMAWANRRVARLLERCYLVYKTRRGRRLGWIIL